MKPATMGNRVRVGILLTMFVGAMLILVMSHATPSLAAGPTAPSFEANSYEFSVDENTAPDTLVQSVAATDLDGDSLTYSVGGTDAAQFNEVFALNTSTGEITVKTGASINYESAEPTSYRVNVMATDGEDDSGATQSQPTTDATATVVIEIVNVDEPGIVTLSTSSPQLGVGLSATLSDPDGRRGGIYNSWWSRANNADGPFFLTADDYYENYRSTTYTPKEADKYLYVKFTIQYFDRTCTRVSTRPGITNRCIKTAERVSASRVADEEGLIVQQQVSNTPATGQVTVTPTSDLQVGYHLNAKARNIRDEDGTQSLRNHLTIFHWRWYRIDPVTAVETQVPSWVHGGWYTWVYVIKDADRGKGIQARVSFLDDYGNTETLRGPLIPIPAPPNNVATGSPVITGTAQVGETLSADLSGVSDADTIVTSTLTYLWYANDGADDTAIEGATDSTYTPVADDVGKTITVQVIFTDGFGYNEVVTSAPTAAVTAATENTDRGAPTETVKVETDKVESNSQATGLPIITGTAQVGETLTAATTGIADSNGLSNATFGYQWLADDAELSGATSSSYTLVAVDKGKAIKVRVSFTDDGGNDESLTSAATDTVDLPLTASVHNVPTYHNGQSSFTFELRFGEYPKSDLSYRSVRDHAFTVTGGSVTHVRRLEPGSNVRWEITVTPSISNTVYLALNATTDCSAQGAICTERGRKLFGRLQLAVAGPNSPPPGTPNTPPPPNTPATGLPTITGATQVGETLTADTTGISDGDGLDNAAFAYQWLADDVEINGATGSTYTLADADEGKAIKVRVSFTDDAENDEELTSAATGAVAAAPPPPNTPATGLPSITGATQVGETLTAGTTGISDGDGLDNATFTYQWLADDAEINGATASTYTLADADAGKAIKVKVTFTDAADNDEELTSAATGAVAAAPPPPNTPATGLPTISGTAQVGETLTADATGISDGDGLDNATFTYQWLADDVEINGATGSTYTLADADEGKAVKVRVSFTDDADNDEQLTSAGTGAVAAAPPPPNTPATGLPAITGTAQVGETLTAGTTGISDGDGLGNAAFAYQWLADDAEINGATASTYTLADADEGKAIKVRVSFTDDAENDEQLNSAATGAVAAAPPPPNTPTTGLPTISGTAQVGETLTAGTTGISDDDGLDNATFTYQWLADDAEINGATASTYTLADADAGKAIKVRVSFTDDAGNDEVVTSAGTGAVAAAPPPPNTPATGLPTIAGTAQVGETLTVDTTGISDGDGLDNAAFAYQWLADDVEINGATGSTYTLADADAGKAIKVRVSFTDDAENDEELTSAGTGAVAAAPPPPNTPATGLPTISGTAQVGETLTAGTTGISDADGLDNAAFAYQWLTDDAEINGATGSTYTLADADEGKAIKVRVSFTDDAENGEVVTSAATGTVAAAVVIQPLTASTRSVPSSHDGSATFIFELRFSEELVSDFSYVTMRDHVLTVAGGSVTYVRRLGPPSNIGWEIHVTPDSDGALIIVLPVTGDCGSDGAICTEDGRMLSNRLQFTVNGP